MFGMWRLFLAMLLCCTLLLIIGMYFPPTHKYTKVFLKLIGGHYFAHFYVGALLPLCLSFFLRAYRWGLHGQAVFWLLILIAFAADEYAQSFSSLRKHDLADFGVSALGWGTALSIWCVWLIFYHYRRRKQLKVYKL